MSNRNWTAVATLLTFCPPGPDDRMKLKDSSLSGMNKVGVISMMIVYQVFFTFRSIKCQICLTCFAQNNKGLPNHRKVWQSHKIN